MKDLAFMDLADYWEVTGRSFIS